MAAPVQLRQLQEHLLPEQVVARVMVTLTVRPVQVVAVL
jgi:hypothetical protein